MRRAALMAVLFVSTQVSCINLVGPCIAATVSQAPDQTSVADDIPKTIGHGILPTKTSSSTEVPATAAPESSAHVVVPLKEAGKAHQLNGNASFNSSFTAKDYEVGMKALEWRLYETSRLRLTRALENLNKTRDGADLKARARLSLAEAYLGLENYTRAKTMFEEAKQACFAAFGPQSPEAARYYGGVAEIYLANGQIPAALEAANQSLHILEKADKPGRELALAQVLVGRILATQSYAEEAKEYLKKALPVLEMSPGNDRLDYANALSALSAIEKKLGEEKESNEQMKKALAIKDDAVDLTKTQDQKGLVKYTWTEGTYGSRQITDPTYPLKYIVVDGIRVACTVVRSYKHVAVLISLANCSPQPIHLAVGSAVLEKTSPGRKDMVYCDPGLIDEVLEEDVILDRTWRRKALCHIQKSRRIPGYLKNGVLDSDDFFGNNEFGLYGAWDSALRDAPPIVTREQFFYDEKPKHSDQEILGFVRGNGSVRPTYIETGAARTGVVFFLRERWDDAVVKLHIGNAELQFPFHVAPGQ